MKSAHILEIALISLLLTACGTPPVTPEQPKQVKTTEVQEAVFSSKKLDEAKQVLKQDDIFKGIRLFEQAIESASDIQKSTEYLNLAEILYDKGYYQLSRRFFNKIEPTLLSTSKKDRYWILQAANELFNDNPQKAIAILEETVDSGELEILRRKLEIQILAYQQLHLPIEQIKSRVKLNTLLNSVEKKQENENRIWNLFNSLPVSDLLIEQDKSEDEYQGWLQYALMIRQNNIRKGSILRLTQRWLNNHINHSAYDYISHLGQQLEKENKPPANIALVLPLTGKYQSVSSAILDGFFIAYYQHIQKYPEESSNISIYDSGSAGKSIWPLINQIKKEKPDLIIGPLQKHYVSQIAQSSHLPVPVLSLNFADKHNNNHTNNLIEFGLYPEDEASQIADYTAKHNLLKAVAIVPKTRFGQRMLTTYQQQLEYNGGRLLSYEEYSRKQRDFSVLIKRLMDIDKSYRRYRKLRVQTGEKFEFEPRIRQDVDTIFLIANNKQAKLINPQFRFFQSGDLPIFSGSLIYDARKEKHKDLNNIRFVNLPWFFPDYFNKEKKALMQAKPASFKANSKFYALGIDTYNILAKLAQFKRNPDFSYPGATGTLSLNSDKQIHRKLKWAIIRYGKMEAIDEKTDLISSAEEQ